MQPGQEEYRGHRIELQASRSEDMRAEGQGDPKLNLVIDGKPVEYGQLPDGQYFLVDYAYDWSGDPMDLARRYIDYQAVAAQIASEHRPGSK